MTDLLDGLGADTVTCWTIQKGAAWRQLQRRGCLQVPPYRVEPYSRPAYDWLCRQHQQRVPGATGRYPVWAYARISRTSLRGFCQWAAQRQPSSVLLVCQLPRAEVTLSDYDTWHNVLNNWHIDPTDDPDTVDAWWDAAEQRYGLTVPHSHPYPPALQAEIEASWPLIFDIDHWLGLFPSLYVQATFETLRLEHVVHAWPLRRPGAHTNRRIGALLRQL